MNPEEGELRPQHLDRFAFCVNIQSLRDPKDRVDIMERRVAFEVDPDHFRNQWTGEEQRLSDRIARAREIVREVKYSRRDLGAIATLTSSMNVDGHRADLVILRGAQAHAAFHGRTQINEMDILQAAELALPHRMKVRACQDAAVSMQAMQERLSQVPSDFESDETGQPTEQEVADPSAVKKNRP